nr:unnamed protein product [Callosobruchus chinensis]
MVAHGKLKSRAAHQHCRRVHQIVTIHRRILKSLDTVHIVFNLQCNDRKCART